MRLRPTPRLLHAAICAAVLAVGCGESLVPTYAVNASGETVIVNADNHGTVTLLPDSYTELSTSWNDPLHGGWQVELVDADCHPLVAVTASDGDQYFYVAPDGQPSFRRQPPTPLGELVFPKSGLEPQCPLPYQR